MEIVGRRLNDYANGWLTALIDSEGSLVIHKPTHGRVTPAPAISIYNTDRAFLEKAASIIDELCDGSIGMALRVLPKRIGGLGKKAQYVLNIGPTKTRRLLDEIGSGLIVKRERYEQVKALPPPRTPQQTSRRRWREYPRTRKVCIQCGSSFERPLAYSNQKFCSHRCYWISLVGTNPRGKITNATKGAE